MPEICEHCFSQYKNVQNLKYHLKNNKRCMKIRGVDLTSDFECTGCKKKFTNKTNINRHIQTCKKYSLLQSTKDLKDEREEIITEYNKLKDYVVKLQYNYEVLQSVLQEFIKKEIENLRSTKT